MSPHPRPLSRKGRGENSGPLSPCGHWYLHNSPSWVKGRDGIHFASLDRRLQDRFYHLVREHAHVLNAAASGLSTLPGTAKPFACTQAMWRFLAHEDTTLPTLIEPVREAARDTLATCSSPVALIVHDWSMIHFGGHDSKPDRLRRTHATDVGYELATAFLVETDHGTPLGPMELRLRTAHGVLTTRPGGAAAPPGRIDEILDVMKASRDWGLERPLVHVIDREADSVGHYRAWGAAGHRFLVRADVERIVRWEGREHPMPRVAAALYDRGAFQDTGRDIRFKGEAPARSWVAETRVVLDRPARTKRDGKKVTVAGEPLTLRLVICRVIDESGTVLAEWFLLTNAPAWYDAATIVQWYYWRWRIESYHKLLKSAGQQVEEWEQESGEAVARRLVIASMACLTVWALRRDESADAAAVRRVLVRLSGRQMKWGVESTAPALLAGLEKLLAVLDVMKEYDLDELSRLVHRSLPHLFNSS